MSGVMEATIDPEQWRLEVERVLPSLKMQHRHDNRVWVYVQVYSDRYILLLQDWRVHYEQMHQYHDGIKNILSDTRVSESYAIIDRV